MRIRSIEKKYLLVLLLYLLNIVIKSEAFVTPQSRVTPKESKFTHLYLFDGPSSSSTIQERVIQNSKIRSRSIPDSIFDRLEDGVHLPIEFRNSNRLLRIKNLEKNDVPDAVSLCLKEYGSYPSSDPQSDDPISKLIQSTSEDFDNFLFSFVVLLGLGQRVERREKSDFNPLCSQDHNVICLCEVDEVGNEKMIGMAEVSLQPPDPARTSPPFVVPTYLKKLLCSFSRAPALMPYISNVLVTDEYRGKGYSKILMACCEGIAKRWDYDEVYLHVDADTRSGRAAQCLYRSINYMPVVDKEYNKNFSWMGVDSVNRGLYIVDGVALLFLKKKLY